MKICNACNLEKDLTCFPKSKECPSGYRGTCKTCYRSGNGRNAQINKLREQRMKKCSRCKQVKSFDDFGNLNSSKDKLMSKCKICWRDRNKEWASQNREKVLKMSREYYKNNREEIIQKTKQWEEKNKHRSNLYRINRRKIDPTYKVRYYLRTRLYKIIKREQKTGSFIKDLGCSLEELKQRLEQKFYPNPETGEIMSWDNYGFYGWHIDHIVPLSSFDLTDRKQFLKACHYTNLQPMWAKENLSKGSRI